VSDDFHDRSPQSIEFDDVNTAAHVYVLFY
jgi:hypothetical protein